MQTKHTCSTMPRPVRDKDHLSRQCVRRRALRFIECELTGRGEITRAACSTSSEPAPALMRRFRSQNRSASASGSENHFDRETSQVYRATACCCPPVRRGHRSRRPRRIGTTRRLSCGQRKLRWQTERVSFVFHPENVKPRAGA